MYYSDMDAITELFVGKSVVHVDGTRMILSDGTLVDVVPNEGGCACSAGDYSLEYLHKVDNVITKVEFDYKPGGDYEIDYDGYYRIFVYAGNEHLSLMSVVGSDGNGYYGTGFELRVKRHVEESHLN